MRQMNDYFTEFFSWIPSFQKENLSKKKKKTLLVQCGFGSHFEEISGEDLGNTVWQKRIWQPSIVQVVPLKKTTAVCDFPHWYTSTVSDRM